MNLRLGYLALLMGSLLIQGCGGDLLDDNAETRPLNPEPSEVVDETKLRPPENAAVITTEDKQILDVSGKPILLRGINLQFGDSPIERLTAIDPIAATGSNVVRLQLRENTTADALEAALNKIIENDMIAMVMFWEEEGKITCTAEDTYIKTAVPDLWLDRWLPVLAQAKYQPYLMINIANEWGPLNIWNASSLGYQAYIDTYKTFIRKFRDAGFKVPLVIDAPHCGQDYNAFLGGRGRELQAADVEDNIILSVHAYHSAWNSSAKINKATSSLEQENMPFILGEFGGSGANGEFSIDHMDLIAKGAGDNAMIFSMPWSTVEDKAAYSYNLPTSINMVGSEVSFDVYMPKSYVEDGNLGIQMYVKDGSWAYGAIDFESASSMTANGWTHITYNLNSVDDFLGYKADGFDPSTVQAIGFEIVANGKTSDIQGDIKIDNLRVLTGVGGAAPELVFEATFDSDLAGFERSWGAGLGDGETPLTVVDGELNILPVWGDAADDGGNGATQEIEVANYTSVDIDLAAPFTMSFDIFVPDEYSSESMEIKLVLKDANWVFGQVLYVGNDSITRGSVQTISASITDFASESSYLGDGFVASGKPNSFGISIAGVTTEKTEAIRVDNFKVYKVPTGSSNDLYTASFDAGVNDFSRSWGAGAGDGETPLTQADGELLVLPIWGDAANDGDGGGGATTQIEVANYSVVEMDIAQPFTLSVDIFVPAEYDTESMDLKLFVKDAGWQYGQVLYVNNSDIVRGTMQTFSFTMSDWATESSYMADGFDPNGAPAAFGFAISGITTEKAEAIRIDNFTISIPAEESSEEEAAPPVLDLNFEADADVEAFAFDFASGAFSDSVLGDAKTRGLGSNPFGWIAWSWFGNGEATKMLDMSNSVDGVSDLTERGMELIDDPDYGIMVTSELAEFE